MTVASAIPRNLSRNLQSLRDNSLRNNFLSNIPLLHLTNINQSIHQPPLLRLNSTNHPPRHNHLHSPLLANSPHKPKQSPRKRNNPPLHLRQSENSPHLRNHNIRVDNHLYDAISWLTCSTAFSHPTLGGFFCVHQLLYRISNTLSCKACRIKSSIPSSKCGYC
ncbi:unnamed protein product [Penicillium salamii]|nr:unnamed protein product [Penicillium salamii]